MLVLIRSCVLFLVCCFAASAQVAYSTDCQVVSIPSGTCNITVSGTNPTLVIHTALAVGGETVSVSSSQAGTVSQIATFSNGAVYNLATNCIIAPAAGSTTITVTASINSARSEVQLFTGADQTNPCPTGDAVTGALNGSADTITLTPLNLGANDASSAVGSAGSVSTLDNVSPWVTPNYTYEFTGPYDIAAGYGLGTGSIVTYYNGSTSNEAGMIAIHIKAAGAAPTSGVGSKVKKLLKLDSL